MTTASDAQSSTGSGLFSRLFGNRGRSRLRALYDAVVVEARARHWYADGGVPDTIDGRFDMVALVLSLVLIRFEAVGGEHDAVRLTELFIDDMDGQVREIGFGDLVVGKQVGRIMAMLGGRLGAYAGTFTNDALVRNLFRGHAPADAELAHTRVEAEKLRERLDTLSLADLVSGRLA